MAISLLNRVIYKLQSLDFHLLLEFIYHQLQKNIVPTSKIIPKILKKTLVQLQISEKLDAKCVSEVLKGFSNDNPQLGLRFFVWAGLQSKNSRHGRFMYSLTGNVLQIHRNPGRIRDVFQAYRVEGCVVNVTLFKVVLNLCMEGGIVDEALWVLRKMGEFKCRPDSTMYNVVIGMLCEKGDLHVAIGLMREMESSNLCPDMITYMLMVKGFCGSGRLEDACLLFKEMKSHGCAANLVVCSALLDGLCRFGQFEMAFELLGEMEKGGGKSTPNAITYTSVIQSLWKHGKSIEAWSILDRMERSKSFPNRITVCVLLKGLCGEGRIDEAFTLVGKIVAEGHVAKGDCYSSLVTGLFNVERLKETEKLFRWMWLEA